MPVLRRQIELSNSNEESFKDNEEIFYCESTKEMFRSYEDYFKRIMLINSMVWTCELSGRTDLTYNEALQSEKSFRKLLKLFPLKIPALLLANQLKCTSWKNMLEEITNYLKNRFCIGEKLALVATKKKKIKYYKVVDIINDKPNEDDPDAYRYKLESDPPTMPQTFELFTGSELYRPNIYLTAFNRDRLKIFLRQFIYQKDNLLHIKEDLFKKYVDDSPIKLWRKYFACKLPVFESPKRYDMIQDRLNNKKVKEEKKKNGEAKGVSKKKVNGENKTSNQNGKQTSISKYLTKASNDNKQGGKELTKDGPSMLEKMRIREEERKKKIELEKERQKNIVALTSKTVRELNQANQEDLKLRDMRPIPAFKPVTTLLPMEYFGDFVAILEFMHSFSDLLTMKDKFQDGMTMDILERALLLRESNGPLNDILQVLLSSIFWLQLEEEEYCDIQYVVPDKNIQTLQVSDNEKRSYYAAIAAKYSNKYYGSKLAELPMDTYTINELIRLHLLSSGACVSATTSRWRFQNRGGYQSIDDPGFEFCNKYPQIVKFLEKSTVFQLPFDDLLKIILCLINQIETYSSVRTEIEERIEQSTTAKINLRNLYTKKRRLKAEMIAHKTELQVENMKKIEELLLQNPPPSNIESIRQDHESKLEKSMLKFEKPLKDIEKDFAKYKRDLFAFQMLLGSDRAYRSYWMFESLPGIFIEHCTPSGKCLETKPDIIPGLADCASDQRYKFIKNYVSQKFFNDNVQNKENINDTSMATNTEDSVSTINGLTAAGSLFMCTTNETDCPVHTVNHPSYVQWSYINTEEELNNLIKSLNSLGIRERQLKECLELQKNLILDHIVSCPVEKLSVDVSQKDVIVDKMIKNMKRYAKNGIVDNPDLVLELATRENIYDLFDKVVTGHLGHLKIKDTSKWGENIMLGNYDEMDFTKLDLEILNIQKYKDPGEYINNLITGSSDESITQYTNNNNNDKSVKTLALALLQIQKGIDKKFLKPPFGGKETTICDRLNLNWQIGLVSCRNYSQILIHYNVMYDAIKWSASIERAYCRICRRRNEPEKMLLCDDCNAGYHMHCLKPKLKSIPDGDWFCVKCKPKSEKKQKKTAKFSEEADDEEFDESIDNRMAIDDEDETFRIEDESGNDGDTIVDNKVSDDESVDEESDEEEEVKKTCKLCNIDFDDDDEFQLVECEKCPLVCHIECAIPPLKHKPRHWICWRCTKKLNKKQVKKPKKKKKKIKQKEEIFVNNEATIVPKKGRPRKSPIVIEDETNSHEKTPKTRKRKTIDSDDDGTPKVKRSRRSIDCEHQNGHQSSNGNRRSRQNDLPLHNVVLHALLDDISRHEDSWPFNRPVSKVDVPDYYQIIKIPMDFAKIKSRLNVGHYTSDYDIMNDIQQIFINCDLYNNSVSEIYKAGIRLEKFVQSKCRDLNLPFRPSDMISDEFEEDDEIPLKTIVIQPKNVPAQLKKVIVNGD